MRPLCEPEPGVRPGFAAGQRQFLAVGDAVHPDGAGAEEIADANREIAWSGAGGDHHVGSLAPDEEKDGKEHAQKAELVPAVGVGDEAEFRPGADVRAVACLGGGEHHVAVGEGRAQAQELHPVAAPGGESEDLGAPVGLETVVVGRMRHLVLPKRRNRRIAGKLSLASLSLASARTQYH